MTRPELLTRPKRKNRLFPILCSILLIIVLLLVVAEFRFVRRYTPVCVEGPSMRNTLQDGDWLYADGERTPRRGDIVIVDVRNFKDATGENVFKGREISFIVKRVIAEEGDTVFASDGKVFLRRAGEEEFFPLDEPYVSGRTGDFDLVTVGAGELFIMGDNRPVSDDSRRFGAVPASFVTGVVPQWALDYKGVITGWENFRESIRDLF